MFGIGSTELLVILVVALIVLGPKSLATVSRALGKAMGEFRRVSTDFRRSLNVEVAREEMREQEAKKSTTAGGAEPPASDFASPPPDSPLGQALAKARSEAGHDSSTGAHLPNASSAGVSNGKGGDAHG